jgi:hypothetical protein
MNNYIYHGSQGLIALPERNVQTFPSGLVRIDRVYACRKTLVDRFRRDLTVGSPLPFDDGAPAFDGAYIFPEPQETIRDDGFAEFRVSAYGRTKATPTIEPRILSRTLQSTITVFRKTVTATIVSQNLPTFSELGLSDDLFDIDSVLLAAVTPEGETIIDLAGVRLLNKSFFSSTYILTLGDTTRLISTVAPGINVPNENLFPLPLTFDQRNFGRWTEFIFAYG